jgi:hypothetical protein
MQPDTRLQSWESKRRIARGLARSGHRWQSAPNEDANCVWNKECILMPHTRSHNRDNNPENNGTRNPQIGCIEHSTDHWDTSQLLIVCGPPLPRG